ncbi:hypothetical protein Mapa_004116 [Marchantia paleacea]|nr:hypothetical protein Mapa_004116 [Marchantia paleacea]
MVYRVCQAFKIAELITEFPTKRRKNQSYYVALRCQHPEACCQVLNDFCDLHAHDSSILARC